MLEFDWPPASLLLLELIQGRRHTLRETVLILIDVDQVDTSPVYDTHVL
jgi:hypothetical protein